MLKSLCFDNTHSYLLELDKENELAKVIPKIKDMKLVGECKYHVVNCFDHSLNALEEFEDLLKCDNFFQGHLKEHVKQYLNTQVEKDIMVVSILKLGIFLHDIGKPDCKTIDETGRVHFDGHEKIGAIESRNLGKILGLQSNTIDLIYKYVRYHMTLLSLYKSNDMSQDNLYKIFDKLQDDIIGILILGYVDIISTRKLLNPNEDTRVIKTYVDYILTNYIYRYKRR